VTDNGVDGYLAALQNAAEMVSPEPEDVPNVITADPPDNWVLATAILGQADVIVSGNDHVLSLKRFERTRIVTPAAFRAMLDSHILP
jgi:predicted nucleic acid-binding protein